MPVHFQTYGHMPATLLGRRVTFAPQQAMQQAVHGVAEESEKESLKETSFARGGRPFLGQENFGEVLVRYNEASGTSSVLRKPF